MSSNTSFQYDMVLCGKIQASITCCTCIIEQLIGLGEHCLGFGSKYWIVQLALCFHELINSNL